MNPSVGARAQIADRVSSVGRLLNRLAGWVDQQTAFRRRIPIRGRIALFGAGVVALTVVVFSVLVYVLVERSLYSQEDTTISRRGDVTWTIVQSGGGLPRGPFRFATDLNKSVDPLTEVFDSNGTPVYWTEHIDGIAPRMSATVLQSAPSDHGQSTIDRAFS
jgi:hypothetical protein